MSLCGQIGPSHTSVLLTKLQQSALSLLQTPQPAAGWSPRPRQETVYKASRLEFWLSPGTESCNQRSQHSRFPQHKGIPKKPKRNSKETQRKGRGGERICLRGCEGLGEVLSALPGNAGKELQPGCPELPEGDPTGWASFPSLPTSFYRFCLCFSPLSLWWPEFCSSSYSSSLYCDKDVTFKTMHSHENTREWRSQSGCAPRATSEMLSKCIKAAEFGY